VAVGGTRREGRGLGERHGVLLSGTNIHRKTQRTQRRTKTNTERIDPQIAQIFTD
jgi:hypothetical protein